MARKLQNKWLTKEQYKDMEEAIKEEQGTERQGYHANLKVTAMLVAKYPSLADQAETAHLSSLVSARRAYMKRRATGTFPWQKKPEETEVNTVSWMSGEEKIKEPEPVSAVRPSMKREAFTPPNNIEAPVSHQEYVTTHTTKKPISPSINDWTVETVVITSNLGVINISLHHPSLNTREMSKILKSILPKQR